MNALLTISLTTFLLAMQAVQGTHGTLIGTVRNPDGDVVPDMFVKATSNGSVATAMTNSKGEYVMSGLERGEYTITAEELGVYSSICERVTVGAAARCDLTVRRGGPPIPKSDRRYQAFVAAESRWRNAGIRSYSYSVNVLCFCAFAGSGFDVRVVDGTPVGPLGPRGDGHPAYRDYNTVERLFDVIRREFAYGSYRIDITYDPRTGAPLAMLIDGSGSTSDDELEVRVTNFVEIRHF